MTPLPNPYEAIKISQKSLMMCLLSILHVYKHSYLVDQTMKTHLTLAVILGNSNIG